MAVDVAYFRGELARYLQVKAASRCSEEDPWLDAYFTDTEIAAMLDEIEALRAILNAVRKEIKPHDDLPHADEQDAADAFYGIQEIMKGNDA